MTFLHYIIYIFPTIVACLAWTHRKQLLHCAIVALLYMLFVHTPVRFFRWLFVVHVDFILTENHFKVNAPSGTFSFAHFM